MTCSWATLLRTIKTVFCRRWGAYVRNGEVGYLEDKREGLESAPDVFAQMLRGDNFGKTLMVVSQDPTLAG